jgi:hypothetical protein
VVRASAGSEESRFAVLVSFGFLLGVPVSRKYLVLLAALVALALVLRAALPLGRSLAQGADAGPVLARSIVVPRAGGAQVVLDGASRGEIMEAYWGMDWPAMRRHMLSQMASPKSQMLGQLEAYLAARSAEPFVETERSKAAYLGELAGAWLARLDSLATDGADPASLLSRPRRPLGPSLELPGLVSVDTVELLVRRASGVEAPAALVSQVRDHVLEFDGPVLENLAGEVGALADIVRVRLHVEVGRDCERVGGGRGPIVGSVLLSPFMSTRPIAVLPSLATDSAYFLYLGVGGAVGGLETQWSATYGVDIRRFESLRPDVDRLDGRRRDLEGFVVQRVLDAWETLSK